MGFEQFFVVGYGVRNGRTFKTLGKAWSRDPGLAMREAEARLEDVVRVAQTLGLVTEAVLIAEGRLWAGPAEVGWPTAEIARTLRESDSLLEEDADVSAILDSLG